jgi:uncharacterized membrane protein
VNLSSGGDGGGGGAGKDERLESLLGNLLITGVVAAAAIVFVGGIFYMIRYGAMPQDYRLFRGEPTDLRSLKGIFRDAFSLNSRGVIQFGLIVLIATPIARVAFSLAAFLREKDWMYTVFTLVVLLVLLYSLVGRQFV